MPTCLPPKNGRRQHLTPCHRSTELCRALPLPQPSPPPPPQAYPLDLVRTRLAAQTSRRYYHGIAHALRSIVAEEGAVGLYRGLGATLMQVGWVWYGPGGGGVGGVGWT